MKILTALVILLMLLSACTTTVTVPVSSESATSIPSDRIYKPSYIGSAENHTDATILFLRDKGLWGGGCGYNFDVDFQKVFNIRSREKITIHVPAGHHVFHIESGGLCVDSIFRYDATVKSGKRYVYRIHGAGRSLRITQIQ